MTTNHPLLLFPTITNPPRLVSRTILAGDLLSRPTFTLDLSFFFWFAEQHCSAPSSSFFL
jgi:hypothetical protein